MTGSDAGEEPALAFGDLPAAMLLIDGDERCRLTEGARDLFGADDGVSLSDLFDRCEQPRLEALLASAATGPALARLQLGGTTGPVTDDGGPPPYRLDIEPPASLARFVELTVRPWGGAGGRIATVTDVTDAVRTHAVLSRVERRAWVVDDHARRVWGPVGYEAEDESEALGSFTTIGDRIHPEDLSTAADAFLRAHEHPGERVGADLRSRHPTQEDHWVRSRFELIDASDDPRAGGLIISTREMTEAFEVPSLARTTGSHLSIAEAAPVGIILTGPLGLPLYFNEAARQLLPGTGVDGDVLVRDWTAVATGSDREKLHAMIATTLDDGVRHRLLATFAPPGTELRSLMVTVSPRLAEDDRVIGLVITLQDLTDELQVRHELDVAQQRLLHLAAHDPLTGLENRAVLAEELGKRLAAVGTPHDIAVLFCDLDGFKAVNDQFGHGVGDELLTAAATRLRDIVGDHDADAVCARVGGDEFVIVLGGEAGAGPAPQTGARPAEPIGARADRLAHEILIGLAQPFDLGEMVAHLGLSIGIALARRDDDVDSVVGRADTAMYAAKADGRGRARRADW